MKAEGESWRTIVRQLPDGAQLQVAARLEPLEDRERRLRLVVLAALVGALLATAFVTRALARLALAPLERLRGTAGEVAETADLSRRVPAGEGPEEVDALAGDLNAMLERLEETAEGREAALASARRFAADAGHELRTPLTSLETNLATGSVDAARRDADRLTALVEQLQALARGEAGPPARVEDVDLGELADQVVLGARSRHPALQVRMEAPEVGPSVRGEAESLRMLLDNLVENAALHGRPDGESRRHRRAAGRRRRGAARGRRRPRHPAGRARARARALRARRRRQRPGDGPRPLDRGRAGRPPRRGR